MKVASSLFFAGLALATPQGIIEKRQVAQELTKGSGCKDVTFIWVRGTTEPANLGPIVGGKLVPELRKVFPSLAVEGVTYGAGVPGNLTPGGGDPAGIAECTKDYNLAATKCPNTIIIGGGYSQGAAITHRTVEKLPKNVQDKIAGITLYGDTQNKQDGGKIKNFPPERVKVFCNGYGELKGKSSDGVCGGMLNVNGGHMSYGDSMKPGAAFLKARVDALKAARGGGAPAAAAGGEKL
jgi:cutinase